MRIIKFFSIFTLFFIIELVLLTLMHHPTVPFVQLVALSALVLGNMPWYETIYMLAGISLSSFMQGFCISTNIVVFSSFTIANLFCGDIMVKNIIAQAVVVLALAVILVGINCPACFTLLNSGIAVLLPPFLIYFLR